MMQMSESFGPEVDDRPLLDFPAESVDVVITNKDIQGHTLKELAERDNGERSRGIFLRKLTRAGNVFSSYWSTDGISWTFIGSATIAMGSTVQIGLAVTAHTTTALSTATFDNVSIG